MWLPLNETMAFIYLEAACHKHNPVRHIELQRLFTLFNLAAQNCYAMITRLRFNPQLLLFYFMLLFATAAGSYNASFVQEQQEIAVQNDNSEAPGKQRKTVSGQKLQSRQPVLFVVGYLPYN